MKKITLILATVAMTLGAWAQGTQDAQSLLKYERYSSAKTALANASSEEDKYNLGLAELGLGNTAAAQQIFTSLGDSEYGQAGMARVNFINGNTAAANALLDKIIDGAKKRDYHKYKLAADAITYTKGGNVDKAIEWYQKAMEKEQTPEMLVSLGDAYLKKGDPVSNGEASRNFEYAIQKDAKYSLAHSRLGLLMYRARNYTKALEHYNAAKAADVNNPLVYRDLALAYFYSGQYQLAKENIEKYLSLSDATEDNLYQYVNILFLSKDYDATLAKLDEVFAKIPNPKPYLYRVKAYSLSEKGRNREALESIDQFFAKKDANTEVLYEDYFYKGKIYASMAAEDTAKSATYLAEANKAFDQAVAIRDTSKTVEEVYVPIAEAFENAKDYANAAKWYKKVIDTKVEAKAEPNSYDYFIYGINSYYSNQYDQALDAFTKMYDKYEKDRYLSEYWRANVHAAKDGDAKTGAAIPYYENWMKITYPEGKTRSNDHLLRAYRYMLHYYYNKEDKANILKYANLVLGLDSEDDTAKQLVEFYKK